ncbi:hypothetical protein JAAARDRAFT_39876 [Jaapia argillacea MUCL 33604]|uniref:RING-type domain-containing protein n=1 Tax=Jaapia argillacea MUCL 33604 TaxID=933084 RepID=A0A067PDH4_9AGAM|nr:hypothetical protein JAAARDRAFT_39876 [Jaapia argillacea MUCL 33604]
MHFSKTYTQLLLSLPPELRENAIEYRQLKKLINQVVLELSSLGLSPPLLHELLQSPDKSNQSSPDINTPNLPEPRDHESSSLVESTQHVHHPKVVYELADGSDGVHPRLRLWIDSPEDDPEGRFLVFESEPEEEGPNSSKLEEITEEISNVESQPHPDESEISSPRESKGFDSRREVVIPLVSDSAFFRLLITTLQSLSTHLERIHSDFLHTLDDLSRTISHSARPTSSTGNFHAYSTLSSDPGTIRLSSLPLNPLSSHNKSDLYTWREFFQFYVESEIFESYSERCRGERTAEEAESRLILFSERLKARGFTDKQKWKLKESRQALDSFLQLNSFILNLKKFQFANAEATRKILKKHTKRTALPLPLLSPDSKSAAGPLVLSSSSSLQESSAKFLASMSGSVVSLPHTLVQAIGETLLPIIPQIDDYACLICTSIAFKPIRLQCGHLFCVRCLVKMQKRGKANCPMCRAPTVLIADRSNVDWALLNFMKDWFPNESKLKLKQNEREAAEEELQELGLTTPGCTIH